MREFVSAPALWVRCALRGWKGKSSVEWDCPLIYGGRRGRKRIEHRDLQMNIHTQYTYIYAQIPCNARIRDIAPDCQTPCNHPLRHEKKIYGSPPNSVPLLLPNRAGDGSGLMTYSLLDLSETDMLAICEISLDNQAVNIRTRGDERPLALTHTQQVWRSTIPI